MVDPFTSFVPTMPAVGLPLLPFALSTSLMSRLALVVAGKVNRPIALCSVAVSSVVIAGEPT